MKKVVYVANLVIRVLCAPSCLRKALMRAGSHALRTHFVEAKRT